MKLETFNWVDVLRVLAAAAVLFAHYHHFYILTHLRETPLPDSSQYPFGAYLWPLYDYGHYAVQLFWTMSGFVFAHVYLNRKATTRQFVVARVARLYPLHFLTLIYVALAQFVSWSLFGHWQIYDNNTLYSFVLQLGMASHWPVLGHGLSFNGPIWSVSIEVLVYVGFWLTLPLILRWGTWLAWGIAVGAWGVVLSGIDLPLALHRVGPCAAFFYTGTVTYIVLSRHRRISLVLSLALAALAVALAVFGAPESVLLGLVAIALIAMAVSADDWSPALGRRLRPLGDISYSLYLVHVPLQMTFLIVADMLWPSARDWAASPWFLCVYVAVSVWLAHLVFRFYERPVGRALRRRLGA